LNIYGGGNGTKSNPYRISYYDQLELLAKNKAKGYFIQTAEIAFPIGKFNTPIDISKEFEFTRNVNFDHFIYDGNGYGINGLTSPLFGELIGSTVDNVTVRNSNITFSERDNIGVIAEATNSYLYRLFDVVYATGDSKITNCSVINAKITLIKLETTAKDATSSEIQLEENVDLTTTENSNKLEEIEKSAPKIQAQRIKNIGGIIGFGGQIENCYVGNFVVKTDYYTTNVGGIAGIAHNVKSSIVSGIDITGNSTSELEEDLIENVGGIVGNGYGTAIYETSARVNATLSGGNIIGCGVQKARIGYAINIGGIMGRGTSNVQVKISNCYATGLDFQGLRKGGIIGTDGGDGNGKYGHMITFCIAPDILPINGYGTKSELGEKVMRVPEYAFKIESILDILNRPASGYLDFVITSNKNDGLPYPKNVAYLKSKN
jgi:hypothetical protein